MLRIPSCPHWGLVPSTPQVYSHTTGTIPCINMCTPGSIFCVIKLVAKQHWEGSTTLQVSRLISTIITPYGYGLRLPLTAKSTIKLYKLNYWFPPAPKSETSPGQNLKEYSLPQTQPTPAWIASSITRGDTGSDPHWGWFGSRAETGIGVQLPAIAEPVPFICRDDTPLSKNLDTV